MKLFVDDLRAPWDGWQLARTVTEAIRILATRPVETVSLDHDIGCRLVSGQEHSSEETFEGVAWYIAAMDYRPNVWFHTSNPQGGRRMADIIGVPYRMTDYAEVEP